LNYQIKKGKTILNVCLSRDGANPLRFNNPYLIKVETDTLDNIKIDIEGWEKQ
jgi:hypothetical protein